MTLHLKILTDLAFLISSGSEFQKIGAETEKAQAPYVLRLCFETLSKFLDEEHEEREGT